MKPIEIIKVSALEVQCDGGKSHASLGHPRVFLHIDQDKGNITCPYCSRQYVLESSLASRHHAH